MNTDQTIAAIATPPGKGGVGIIRVSGPAVQKIAQALLGCLPAPRFARYSRFKDGQDHLLDEGIALFFPGPASYTGEDILELQGHGGPVVMDLLLQRVLECGARQAQPGEFSKRAFLNDKLDLTQAEAVADLIESQTATAARLAVRSLDGEFSRVIQQLVELVISLRMYVEAAIDFPEEEIDFLNDGKVSTDLAYIIDKIKEVEKTASVGRLLRDGMVLVIAGLPNAGKSSLLNRLSGRESAIVTELAGTTRDLLRESVQIDGMPLHLIDTAGLRESNDPIEQEGVRRAREEISKADRVLWIYDATSGFGLEDLSGVALGSGIPVTLVRNKIDRVGENAGSDHREELPEIALSALTGEGMDFLRSHLKTCMNYQSGEEGEFIARRRHLDGIKSASKYLLSGKTVLHENGAGELLAEDLRLVQQSLSEITGEFSSDDLLGRIFSSFCIGK